LVGAALASGIAAAAGFAACSGGAPSPPKPAPAAPPPTQAGELTAQPPEGGAAGDAGAISWSCESPRGAILEAPDGGVVFNNAMTSADAGQLDRGAAILATLGEQSQQILCCFDGWLDEHPGEEAEVLLELLLEADGRVIDAGVTSKRVADERLTRCLAGLAQATTFPPSPRDSGTLVKYPIRVGSRLGDGGG
jgi:hypothetical protein